MSAGGSTARWLVTGGCGFVGVNLLRALAARGIRARVLDNLTVGHREDIAGLGAEVIVGDIRNPTDVQQAIDGVDVVVHLAAHTRVIESIESPRLNFEINALGTLTLLEALRLRGGLSRFVLASTGGAILGDADPPVHEGLPARPLSPYGASKLACEGYCSAYFGAYELPTVSLRFSNVFGPFSYDKGSVVAAFFKRILANEPLVIYGDGRQTRDFVFVEDLCRAILAATERPCAGEVFHVASGLETEIGTLATQMLKIADCRVPIEHRPARTGEVRRNAARIDHAHAVLGWEPHTRLEDGLGLTWQWFQQWAAARPRS